MFSNTNSSHGCIECVVLLIMFQRKESVIFPLTVFCLRQHNTCCVYGHTQVNVCVKRYFMGENYIAEVVLDWRKLYLLRKYIYVYQCVSVVVNAITKMSENNANRIVWWELDVFLLLIVERKTICIQFKVCQQSDEYKNKVILILFNL